MTTSKTLTLRLPAAAYDRATALAKRRHLSLNRLFQESLELMDRQEREKCLYDDFSRIAAVVAECDVDYAAAAQSEAVSAP